MTNPVEYAETKLGVHEIHAATEEAHTNLDSVLGILADRRDALRKTEQDKEDLEMELAIAERGKHADMSGTAMQAHLKQVYFQHLKWREYRDEIRKLRDDIDGAEMDRKIHERSIEIGCARMNELGGYFNYLASAKNAATAMKLDEASKTSKA